MGARQIRRKHDTGAQEFSGFWTVIPDREPQSVTEWISALKCGDDHAATKIFDRYFPSLIRIARAKFKGRRGIAADEEVVAISAMRTLCRRAELGGFPELRDRDDLWALLLAITSHKVVDAIRWETRTKRDRNPESAVDDNLAQSIETYLSPEPSPEFIVALEEQNEILFSQLDDDAVLGRIANAKMEGYSNEEIAQQLGLAVRTVYRKLNLIRERWLDAYQRHGK